MIDFRTFESLGSSDKNPVNKPEYLREPQGKLRRSAAVKVYDKIGVGNSSIADKGVFAVDHIEEGEVVEVAPLLLVKKSDVQNTPVMDYVFKITDDQYAIAFGYASMYNHRNQPSVTWKIDEDKKEIKFTAIRDIASGEEIFISYGKAYWQTRDISAKVSPNVEDSIKPQKKKI